LEELLMRHALEFPGSDSQREQFAAGVMMIPVPKSGVLEAVTGEDAARRCAGRHRSARHGAATRLRRKPGLKVQVILDFYSRERTILRKLSRPFAKPTKN